MNALKTFPFIAFLLFLSGLPATAVADEQPPEALDSSETDEFPALTTEEELLQAAAAIADRVAEIRGLPQLKPIPKGVKDREQLRALLLERFDESVPLEEFEAEADVYKRMGLFPSDLNYRELMLDLLTEQIAGFYDQSAGELYIMEGLPEPLQRSAMAHEIYHGIQDQHFDLGRLLEPFSSDENADFYLARMALIEGDASVVMADYELFEAGVLPQNTARSIADIPMVAALFMEMDFTELAAAEQLAGQASPELADMEMPSLSTTVLGSAPPIVRDVLLFPYVGGMQFVLRARAGRSWKAFDQIYYDAPASTSQILHPERYFENDLPLEVRFDVSEGLPGYEPIYESVLGELRILSWLNTFSDLLDAPLDTETIAAGWDGDRLLGYRGPDDEVVVVHLSTWRSESQAREFAAALDEIARARHGTTSAHRAGEHGESWCLRVSEVPDVIPDGAYEDLGRRVYIERWGELVLYIEGTPSDFDDARREQNPLTGFAREAAFGSLQRVPFAQVLAARKAEMAAEADQESSEPPQ